MTDPVELSLLNLDEASKTERIFPKEVLYFKSISKNKNYANPNIIISDKKNDSLIFNNEIIVSKFLETQIKNEIYDKEINDENINIQEI